MMYNFLYLIWVCIYKKNDPNTHLIQKVKENKERIGEEREKINN